MKKQAWIEIEKDATRSITTQAFLPPPVEHHRQNGPIDTSECRTSGDNNLSTDIQLNDIGGLHRCPLFNFCFTCPCRLRDDKEYHDTYEDGTPMHHVRSTQTR